MIGQYFNMMFDFLGRMINEDFGTGFDLGGIILAFFTLIAFLRFFIKPILGVKFTSGISRGSKSKKE